MMTKSHSYSSLRTVQLLKTSSENHTYKVSHYYFVPNYIIRLKFLLLRYRIFLCLLAADFLLHCTTFLVCYRLLFLVTDMYFRFQFPVKQNSKTSYIIMSSKSQSSLKFIAVGFLIHGGKLYYSNTDKL